MPRVTIGLPVCNGASYLAEALESLCRQTWSDFEVIISDNASTDATESICRNFAARDPRIRYYRNRRNIGASANFNRVLRLASGTYFKWMAHDDILAPEFLGQCLQVLEANPKVVLVCSQVACIDERSEITGIYDFPMRVDSDREHVRFTDLLLVRHPCTLIFGLIRRKELLQAGRIGHFTGADRCLLASLSLHGQFVEIPGHSFLRRDHPETSCRKYDNPRERNAWFDPRRQGGIYFPEWRIAGEYLRIIRQSPISARESLLCTLGVGRMLRRRWRLLFLEVLLGGRDLLQRSRPGSRLFSFCRAQMRRLGIDPYAVGGKKQKSKP